MMLPSRQERLNSRLRGAGIRRVGTAFTIDLEEKEKEKPLEENIIDVDEGQSDGDSDGDSELITPEPSLKIIDVEKISKEKNLTRALRHESRIRGAGQRKVDDRLSIVFDDKTITSFNNTRSSIGDTTLTIEYEDDDDSGSNDNDDGRHEHEDHHEKQTHLYSPVLPPNLDNNQTQYNQQSNDNDDDLYNTNYNDYDDGNDYFNDNGNDDIESADELIAETIHQNSEHSILLLSPNSTNRDSSSNQNGYKRKAENDQYIDSLLNSYLLSKQPLDLKSDYPTQLPQQLPQHSPQQPLPPLVHIKRRKNNQEESNQLPASRQNRNQLQNSRSIVLKLHKVPTGSGGTNKINNIDIISQIVLDLIEIEQEKIESPSIRKAVGLYHDAVAQEFYSLIDAIDLTRSLTNSFRKAELKRNNLRMRLLELRQERSKIQSEIQKVRDENMKSASQDDYLKDIGDFANEIEKSRGGLLTSDADSDSMVINSIQSQLDEVNPILSTHYGTYERLLHFNNRLEEVLERSEM